jgi:acyl carrier protein
LWFDDASTEEKVLWWFRNRFGEALNVDPEQITPATSFADELGADSLEVVELVMGLEEEFGIAIPDAEAEKIKTVSDAMQLIQSLAGHGGAESS